MVTFGTAVDIAKLSQDAYYLPRLVRTHYSILTF